MKEAEITIYSQVRLQFNLHLKSFQPGSLTLLITVSFEILGMMSRTFHIQDCSFTYIPNPTSDRWDKRSFSLVKILESYRVLSEYELPHANRNWAIYSKITHHTAQVLNFQDEGRCPNRLLFLKALHNALDDCDEILTSRDKTEASNGRPLRPEQPSVDSTEETLRQAKQNRRREVVQDVLRGHVQEVLRLLNEREERPSDTQSLLVPDLPPGSPRTSRYHERIQSPRFEDVDACGPDEKQHRLMEVYFEVIRKHVVQLATQTTERRASFAGPRNFAFRHRGSVGTFSSAAAHSDSGADDIAVTVHASGVDDSRLSMSSLPANGMTTDANDDDLEDSPITTPLADEHVSHDDIWCTLIFRMICWLMLHDFDKQDVQLSKSELLGSRMPVYIA